MTESEAADLLAVKVATLRAWRHNKKGPAFLKLGRAVRYAKDDMDRFIASSRVDTNRNVRDAAMAVECGQL